VVGVASDVVLGVGVGVAVEVVVAPLDAVAPEFVAAL
jgi:hypothetical protein